MNDSTLPSAHGKRQPRFYYGYIIVLTSSIILLLAGGTLYSFGVFFKPVLTEFGWTRAATSGAYSVNMILNGLVGILAGKLTDKLGPRIVLTVCGIFIGLGYLLMSQVQAIWQIYLFFGVLISIGMSGMAVPLMATTARWFNKGRGLATGIIIAGSGVGIVVMPPLATLLISSYNWRTSYIILGGITLTIMAIMAQFLKDVPHTGIPSAHEATETPAPDLSVQSQGHTFRQAIFTWPFWVISIIGFGFSFGLQTIMVHLVAHATDVGISAGTAATVLSVLGIVSIGGNILFGKLGDKVGNRNVVIAIFILMTLSFLFLIFSNQLWALYLFAVVFGLSYGGWIPLQSPLIAEYFGLISLGAILGLTMFITTAGGALGSLVSGRIFDITGGYNWAFIVCGILSLLSLMLAVLLKFIKK